MNESVEIHCLFPSWRKNNKQLCERKQIDSKTGTIHTFVRGFAFISIRVWIQNTVTQGESHDAWNALLHVCVRTCCKWYMYITLRKIELHWRAEFVAQRTEIFFIKVPVLHKSYSCLVFIVTKWFSRFLSISLVYWCFIAKQQ